MGVCIIRDRKKQNLEVYELLETEKIQNFGGVWIIRDRKNTKIFA